MILATTTVTITRAASSGDPTDAPTVTTIAENVEAVIGSPSGTSTGNAEQVDAVLNCDPVDLAIGDLIDDTVTGERWTVAWTRRRVGLGLDHQTAGLRRVKVGNGG